MTAFSSLWAKDRAMRYVQTEYGAEPDLSGPKDSWTVDIPADEFFKDR